MKLQGGNRVCLNMIEGNEQRTVAESFFKSDKFQKHRYENQKNASCSSCQTFAYCVFLSLESNSNFHILRKNETPLAMLAGKTQKIIWLME